MDQKLNNATEKLRNFKEFLALNPLYRSLRKSKGGSSSATKRNASHDGLESADNFHQIDDDHEEDGTEEYVREHRNSNQNSISMFDLVDPPMSSSRPQSMALSTHLNLNTKIDSSNSNTHNGNSNIGKSISLYGLSNNITHSTPSSAITNNKKSQNHYSTSRNPAVRLFHTIRAKLGLIRKGGRRNSNRIVDNSKNNIGSYFSSPSSSNKTPPPPRRRASSILQPDNLILSSSRSQENVLGSGPLDPDRNSQLDVLGVRGLQRQNLSTSAISSPHINSVGIGVVSGSGAVATHDNQNDRNTDRDLGCIDDGVRPPLPVKQRTLNRPTTTTADSTRKSDTRKMPLKSSLTKELCDLLHYGWYWGGMSKEEAEEKLKGEPDGAFVVRDSSSSHYLLSLSFNSHGKTLHTRIEYRNGKFCFYSSETESFDTVAELIDYWMTNSEQGTFCYSRSRHRNADIPSYPVRLSKPVSRFTEVKSLAHLSRFVIRQYTRVDLIPQLPLPQSLIDYVGEQKYI